MWFLYHFYHNKAERKRKIEGGRERDRMKERGKKGRRVEGKKE